MKKSLSKIALAAGFRLALTVTLFACSGEQSDPSVGEPSSSSPQQNTLVFCQLTAGTCSQMSLSACMELVNAGVAQIKSSCSVGGNVCGSNDLGKGYDVIGKPYINWKEVNTITVLDQDKMCQDGILELDKPGNAQQYTSFSGNTIKEFYSNRNKSMKIDASVEGSIDIAFVFSVDFDVKFAMKTSSGSQQNQSLKYYYSQIRSYLYTGEDQIKSGSASAQNLSKYLTSDFISDLKSAKSPGYILDRYGSHVFIHYYKGGSLEANYTYIGSESSSRFTSASEMEAAAKASFAKFDGKISGGTSNSTEQKISELEQHMSFNYETYGGNALKANSMTQLGNEYGSWVSSIASNARTTGIKDFAQSFITIWDLAQQVEGVTTERINALKDEFKRRAEAQGKKFPVDEIPCTPNDNSSTHYCSNGSLREYGSVTYSGKTYKTVVIGTQTWMAENLNYEASGSKCYNNQESNCGVYGRLYNWATAMGFQSDCNSTSCISQISAKHKGICPAGYHIPTDANWDALMTTVGGSSTAGRYLKAITGWSNCGSGSSRSYKCEDKYGFTALPGGIGYSSSYFFDIGSEGSWWSASEGSFIDDLGFDYAYYRSIDYDNENAFRGSLAKSGLTSVRCVKD